MNTITTVGIDLAKSAFSLHGVDANGKTVLRKTLSRNKLLRLTWRLPQSLSDGSSAGGIPGQR